MDIKTLLVGMACGVLLGWAVSSAPARANGYDMERLIRAQEESVKAQRAIAAEIKMTRDRMPRKWP